MSFKNNPFDRFSHFDPESKLSEFRKNFFQNQNKMFSDSNRWPNGVDSHLTSMNSKDNGFGVKKEEGIPIKVFHETSDDRLNNESNDDKNPDSMSSFGSSQSQRSNDSSNSSGSVFNSNRSHDSGGGEPRVYHIPITVEPREGSTSSGYTSEANVNTEQPLSRSSSHSSAHSTGSGSVRSQRSFSPKSFIPSKTSSEASNTLNDNKERLREIPIKVEVNQKSAHPSNESIPIPKSKGTTQTKPKPKSGPFVTRIPVINPEVSPAPKEETSPEPNASEIKEVPKSNPLDRINEVLNDLKKYENEVKQFEGSSLGAKDKRYRFLDEMLTRCMIKLDTIETNGIEEVRKARKAAVLAVNQCIALLEQKVDKNNTKGNSTEQSGGSDEPMQTTTPEPIQQKNEENKCISENESQNIETTEQMDTKTEDSQKTKDLETNENDSQNQSTDKNNTKESHRKETAV